MTITAPQSLCPGTEVADCANDYRGAVRVAQYRISQKAFYLPSFPGTKYIPFSALTAVCVRVAALPTMGCCGKELPVTKLTLRYHGGKKDLVIDPARHADTILAHIRQGRPELVVDDKR